MAKLEGIDVSHWNADTAIIEHNPDFVMIKLTEGYSFRDNKAAYHSVTAEACGAVYGYYHYARAERNNPRDEAVWFCQNIPEEARGKCLLALDFEGKSLSITDVDTWALEFMDEVEKQTGVKPLLYASQSVVKRFPKVQANNNGLWVARYRNKTLGYGDVKPWKFAAMWQYTSNPIDKDVFYGNKEQLKKYANWKGE